MSGHSHWHNIKRKKEKKDQKRAKKFAKLSQKIITAVRDNDKETDPEINADLRAAIEKAKTEDMPKENIERAIQKGAGEGEEGLLEDFSLEVYGPDGIGIIIEGETDNRNRTLADIKGILKQEDGKLAEPGSVKWLFEDKGVIETEKTEENELAAMEANPEGIDYRDDTLIIYTNPKQLNEVKEELDQQMDISFSGIGYKPKTQSSDREQYQEFINKLEDQNEVEKVYFTTNT